MPPWSRKRNSNQALAAPSFHVLCERVGREAPQASLLPTTHVGADASSAQPSQFGKTNSGISPEFSCPKMDHPELAKSRPERTSSARARESNGDLGFLCSLLFPPNLCHRSSLKASVIPTGPVDSLANPLASGGTCFSGAYRCRMNHSAARSSPVGFRARSEILSSSGSSA